MLLDVSMPKMMSAGCRRLCAAWDTLAHCCLLAYVEQTKPTYKFTREDMDLSDPTGARAQGRVQEKQGLIAAGLNWSSF